MEVSLLPVPKELKQLLFRPRKARFLRYAVQHVDGEPYLLNIVFAARTLREMRLKPFTHLRGQGVLQIVGNQLHNLLTAQFIVGWHIVFPSLFNEIPTNDVAQCYNGDLGGGWSDPHPTAIVSRAPEVLHRIIPRATKEPEGVMRIFKRSPKTCNIFPGS
jgi:hypothetical protein